MPTLEKLLAQLHDLKDEERRLEASLEGNRRRQATIISSLQVKPDANEVTPAPKRRTPVTHGRTMKALRETVRSNTRPSAHTATVAQQHPGKEQSAADRVRAYVASAPDDAVITPETVATALGISKTSTVSTALNRMAGKLIERVPGTQRGKFRKINRAA